MTPAAITVRCARGDEELRALEPGWRALFAAAGQGHVFQSWRWFQAWRAVFDPAGRTQVLALWRNGQLVGVQPLMPLRTWRGPALRIGYDIHPDDNRFLGLRHRYRFLPVRQLSAPVAAESSNLRGLLLAFSAHRADCEAALFKHLAGRSGWDLGVFMGEADTSRLADAAHRAGLQCVVRPALHHFRGIQVTPWEQYLEARTRAFRKNMRQADAAGAGLTARTYEGAAEVAPLLGELFDVAARSWKATGREGERDHLPLTDRTRRFVGLLCDGRDAELQPLLVLLTQGGRTVAAALCLRAGPRLFGSLIYHDLAVAAASPGRHLMKTMLQWAAAAGVGYFDLNGESRMNQYFANHTESLSQLTVFSRGVYGQALHRLALAVAHRSRPDAPVADDVRDRAAVAE